MTMRDARQQHAIYIVGTFKVSATANGAEQNHQGASSCISNYGLTTTHTKSKRDDRGVFLVCPSRGFFYFFHLTFVIGKSETLSIYL